jgi:glycogen operon protein
MREADWNYPDGRFLSYVLAASRESGQPLFVVLNGVDEPVDVTFPEWPGIGHWQCVLDTAKGQLPSDASAAGATWSAQPRSVLAFAGRP